MEEENPKDNPDIPQDNPEIQSREETHVDIPATDSYDELAGDAEVEQPKRGRGRPKGAKNRPKPPPPESEEEELPPPPKRKKGKSSVAPLEVEFDEGYGGAGAPKKAVRIKRPPTASRSLMDTIAEAAQQHGMRERDRRRNFYESFLPM